MKDAPHDINLIEAAVRRALRLSEDSTLDRGIRGGVGGVWGGGRRQGGSNEERDGFTDFTKTGVEKRGRKFHSKIVS